MILIGVLVVGGIGFLITKIAWVNHCGGIFNKQCSLQLHCELDDFRDTKFGEVGKCYGLGGLVECGGIGGINCPDGFFCDLFEPDVADSFGKCIPLKKTTFKQFEAICRATGGSFTQPFCDSPQFPDCSIQNAICDCSAIFPNFVDTYKNIKDTNYNGCRIA